MASPGAPTASGGDVLKVLKTVPSGKSIGLVWARAAAVFKECVEGVARGFDGGFAGYMGVAVRHQSFVFKTFGKMLLSE